MILNILFWYLKYWLFYRPVCRMLVCKYRTDYKMQISSRAITVFTKLFSVNYFLTLVKCKMFLISDELMAGFKDELMCATVITEVTHMGRRFWKMLRIMIDSALTFDNHVKGICKNASKKHTEVSIECQNFMSKIKKKVWSEYFLNLNSSTVH